MSGQAPRGSVYQPGWTVRVPRSVRDNYLRVRAAIDTLNQSLGRTPQPSDVAAHPGISEEAVREAIDGGRSFTVVSLDDTPDEPGATRKPARPTMHRTRLGQGQDADHRLARASPAKPTAHRESPLRSRAQSVPDSRRARDQPDAGVKAPRPQPQHHEDDSRSPPSSNAGFAVFTLASIALSLTPGTGRPTGAASLVARMVGASEYNQRSPIQGICGSNWGGVSIPGFPAYPRERGCRGVTEGTSAPARSFDCTLF